MSRKPSFRGGPGKISGILARFSARIAIHLLAEPHGAQPRQESFRFPAGSDLFGSAFSVPSS
jgi:hypothetical protein